MKKLVTERPPLEVHISELIGREIVAYRCNSSKHIAVLTVMPHGLYGFINLGYSNSSPTFIANSWIEAIRKAANQRKLYVFDSQTDLVTAIYQEAL